MRRLLEENRDTPSGYRAVIVYWNSHNLVKCDVRWIKCLYSYGIVGKDTVACVAPSGPFMGETDL